jgi:hypothetical protein
MISSDRKPYLSATTIDQDFLDSCFGNLENRLEMIVDIETPDGVIYASDRNKYVGNTFYQALLQFPVIGRTVGEWLAPELQFSTLTLDLSNVDGRFNKYLPGGDTFDSWVGKRVIVMLGLAEQATTYRSIFSGTITDVGGFKRNIATITIIARDDFDKINQTFPRLVLDKASYPKLGNDQIGRTLPVIYGSWLNELEPDPAIVPTIALNSADPMVNFAEKLVTISIGSPAVFTCNENHLENGDKIWLSTNGTLPSPLTIETDYYVRNIAGNITFNLSSSPSGPLINTSTPQSGDHQFLAAETAVTRNLKLIISENALKTLDINNIYLKKSDIYSKIPTSEIQNVSLDNRTFEIKIRSGISWVDVNEAALAKYVYDSGDEILVRCIGKDLGSYTDNIISQATDILKTYGNCIDTDFDTNWTTYRDKSTPSISAISTMLSRVWISEPEGALTYALSMLEQVRLEAFIDENLKIKINSLHFEDFNSSPSFKVNNWDIEKDSLQVSVDEQNNFNRAQGVYAYSPIRDENSRSTMIYKNDDSIAQVGKSISKKLVFPNLYVQNTVIDQLKEILKMSSAFIEVIDITLTWRALLLDIGNFVNLNIQLGSTEFINVPCMLRNIGYDPNGLKLPCKLWSFQMCPYPDYEPSYEGIVGGFNATITSE